MDAGIEKHIAKRLLQQRQAIAITQLELSNRTGIKKARISEFENGKVKPSLDNLSKLAAALNCSMDYLCGLTEFNFSPTNSFFKELFKDLVCVPPERHLAVLETIKVVIKNVG